MAFGNAFPVRWLRLYLRPTGPELALEPAVAALGVPYRFQHPIPGMRTAEGKTLSPILDFAVYPNGTDQPGIAFEVDGESHFTPAGRAKDAIRTATLEAAGWVVCRCTNEEATSHPDVTVARMWAEAMHADD